MYILIMLEYDSAQTSKEILYSSGDQPVEHGRERFNINRARNGVIIGGATALAVLGGLITLAENLKYGSVSLERVLEKGPEFALVTLGFAAAVGITRGFTRRYEDQNTADKFPLVSRLS